MSACVDQTSSNSVLPPRRGCRLDVRLLYLTVFVWILWVFSILVGGTVLFVQEKANELETAPDTQMKKVNVRSGYVEKLQETLFNNSHLVLYIDQETTDVIYELLYESAENFETDLNVSNETFEFSWLNCTIFVLSLSVGCGLSHVQPTNTMVPFVYAPLGLLLLCVAVLLTACLTIRRVERRRNKTKCAICISLGTLFCFYLLLLTTVFMVLALVVGVDLVEAARFLIMTLCALPVDYFGLAWSYRECVVCVLLTLVPINVTMLLIFGRFGWAKGVRWLAGYGSQTGSEFCLIDDTDDRCDKVHKRMAQCSPIAEVARAFDLDEQKRLMNQPDIRDDERSWLAEVRHYDEPVTPTEVVARHFGPSEFGSGEVTTIRSTIICDASQKHTAEKIDI